MADPFPALTRVVEFIAPSLRPRDAVGTPGVIPSTLAADLAAVVATCEAADGARARAIEECAQHIESEIAIVRRVSQPGAGVRVEPDHGDLVDLTWNRACRNLAAKLRRLLPAPAPATETEGRADG